MSKPTRVRALALALARACDVCRILMGGARCYFGNEIVYIRNVSVQEDNLLCSALLCYAMLPDRDTLHYLAPHILLPLRLLSSSLIAPRSCSVGSWSLFSAFNDTGSPSCVGFSFARSLSVL